MQPESSSPKQPGNTTSTAENAREGIDLETGIGPDLEATAGRQEIRNATAASAMGKRRGLFGSFPEFDTLGGFALGTAVMLGFQLAPSEEAMMARGWRVPFMLALPMSVLELVSSQQARGHPGVPGPRGTQRGPVRQLAA